MTYVTVKGIVFSGEKVGRQFVEISWVKKQIKEKLGFNPYPGTLNIRLPRKEVRKLEKFLAEVKGPEITPAKGFLRAQCFKVLIMDRTKGAIIIPEKRDYPLNVLEILAPVYLREVLSLKDGDEAKISIYTNAKIKP